MEAYLILESGEVFQGESFGYHSGISGEVVFQTGMVGYVESLTDPSYKNQILVLTYPLIGNYGVPSKEFWESDKIHCQGLIVGEYVENNTHHQSEQTLDMWLKEFEVPGISGIDTRELTKIIREKGTVKGRIVYSLDDNDITFEETDVNLVDLVSTKQVYTVNLDGKTNVMLIDCGVKRSQIRELVELDCSVTIVPWDYDFTDDFENLHFDGLFISNGPGDPEKCSVLIERLREFMKNSSIPIFGICLGHQILALSAGCKSYKMKYGNRGHNIPAYLHGTKRCFVTSQNHGYAIDNETIPNDWEPLFINANDGTNEGIRHKTKPFYSVQFHPEASGGPTDTRFFFQLFVENRFQDLYAEATKFEPNLENLQSKKKVLILGSGGLQIGQSGEFDYSGSQAVKAFREEGLQTILINPNIATVQTSPGFADKVYFLPIDASNVVKVIEQEKPDCISLSFGGQTALNCGIQLKESGILDEFGIEILGTPIQSVIDSEDRQVFAQKLKEIGESVPPGHFGTSLEDALEAAEKLGYPVLIRAANALGGLGSGFAKDEQELRKLVNMALSYSDQITIDKDLRGWKEVEYEIVRDAYDNCIAVCNMENVDPLGIHTGESIVVAPSQTLNDKEYHMLREVGIKTVRMLGIVGECNIQYALNPVSTEYYIIEVNARLSRSSALASKATGYPLAYVAAKLGLGHSLLDLRNSITKETSACFEPSLDYCVVKCPRWDLRKFPLVSTKIDSAMKSIGESMAISRSFEEAFQKALRMAHMQSFEPGYPYTEESLRYPDYTRIFSLATALYEQVYPLVELHEITGIDPWFLERFQKIINMQKELENNGLTDNLLPAKKLGFSDKHIAQCAGTTELVIRDRRYKHGIVPKVKQIDTVAGEFPCYTNYLYLTYSADYDDIELQSNGILVLGSGVYQIGSSVEFDWCTVNCVRELRKMGYRVSVINCNPETVSTDYDEADRLFFDELSFETVMDVYQMEKPINQKDYGVVLAMGGQLPNNIAMQLHRQGVRVIGTHPDKIDGAENRYKFSRLLDELGIDQPKWKKLSSLLEAKQFSNDVEYPVLVRPSYVLSGAAMNIAYSDVDLENYLGEAVKVSKDHPVVISKFISDAKEIEVDAVAKNGQIKLIAVSEHVENAGVHSGDATLILPPQDITKSTMAKIRESTARIALSLDINGPFNIQYIAKNDAVMVIECNLRVSRSFPFVSKTLNVNFVEKATQLMMGLDMEPQLKFSQTMIGVKVPQFSFHRLKNADIGLGVEMLSTGEVACFGENKYEAFLKGAIAALHKVPLDNSRAVLLSIGSYRFKQEFVESVQLLLDMGFKLYGTFGTADFYTEMGLLVQELPLFSSNSDNSQTIVNYLAEGEIGLVINISKKNKIRCTENALTDGYKIRRAAVENDVGVITDIKFAKMMVKSIAYYMTYGLPIKSGIDCFTSYNIVKLPGLIDVHVHLRDPGDTDKEDILSGTQAALAGGFTTVCMMPNTKPPIVDRDTLDLIKEIAESKAVCDYGIYVGGNSENTESVRDLAPEAAALKLYLNNTYGPLLLESSLDWLEHVKNWPDLRPLCVHAESKSLPAILHMANICQKKIHVCHVARKEEIEIIRYSKEMGMDITCEVAPHHLFVKHGCEHIDEDCQAVKPPLMYDEDIEALWQNIDIIDCFATDHAPHTVQQKKSHGCPGFPGLETALPLLLTAVKQGKLTLDQVVEKCYTNPKKIFNIPDQEDTYIEVDLDQEWHIPEKMRYSKCSWTPFAKMKVYGMVKRVVLRGKVVYVDGQVTVQPGYGKNIREVVQEPVEVFEMDMPKVKPVKPVYHTISSILTAEQFDRESLRAIFRRASEMRDLVERHGRLDLLKDKMMGSIFYEPSTRTRCSFTAAMKRLGGEVVEIAAEGSSVKKGESLEDFVRCIESYCDLIVLRSPSKESTERAFSVLNKPLINAGNGSGEHPTQALLDAFTIREERGSITNATVTMLGDLKNGRTVHSLAKLLANYQVRLQYVSPNGLEMPEEIKEYVQERGVEQTEHLDLAAVLETTDVLYVTRIQKERFTDLEEYEQVKGSYCITPELLAKSKTDLVVMHPLPRVDEISPDLDMDSRAAYFRQMENGLYVRMALLAMVFGR